MSEPRERPWLAVTDTLNGRDATAQRISTIEFGGAEPGRLISSSAGTLGSAAVYGHCLDEIPERLEEAIRTSSIAPFAGLDGSYSAIVSDGRVIRVRTDMSGQFPLFYRATGDKVDISSGASRLAGDDGFDATCLAAQIIAPFAPDLYADRSAFLGVHRIEPGTTATFEAGRVHITRDMSVVESASSLGEAADLLRSTIFRSMAKRASRVSEVSCDFSGGIDSTSLAYIAASLHDGVIALTRHDPQHPVEDYAVVQALLRLPESARLRWFELNLGAQNPAGWLKPDYESDEPNLLLRARDNKDASHSFAASKGVSMHLSGVGADEIAIAGLEYLTDLARGKNYVDLLRAAHAEARIYHKSPWQLVKQAWAASAMGPEDSLRTIGIALCSSDEGNQAAVLNQPFPLDVGWLTRQARQAVSELALERAENLRGEVGTDMANYVALRWLQVAGSANSHAIGRAFTHHGIDAHTPYLDDNVIRACLATAGHNRANPAVYKQIMRIAFAGLVPPQVLTRDSKSGYNDPVFNALRAKMPLLQQMMRDSRLADLGIIEPREVNAALQRVMRGELPSPSLDALIAQEFWLRGRESLNSPYYNSSRNSAKEGMIPNGMQPVAITAPCERIASLDTNAAYRMSSLVRGVEFNDRNGVAFFNAQTGDRFSIPHALAVVVRRLVQADSLETAIQESSRGLNETEAETMRRLILSTLPPLLSDGLLVRGKGEDYDMVVVRQRDGTNLQEKDSQQTFARPEWGEASPVDYALATVGTATALLAMKAMKFGGFSALMRFLQERWVAKDATVDQTSRTQAAVHRVGALYPGKMACLEFSSSTALTLALRRKRVAMVIGAATNPLAFDAWVEVEGEPVTRPRDDNPYRYTPLHRI